MTVAIQFPSLVLPQAWTLGTEAEVVADLVEHTSIEFPTEYIHDKIVTIVASEVVALGVPGNLWVWVELSPYPTLNSTYWPVPLPVTGSYWSAIGGGGGAIAPIAPLIIIGTGVNGTIHTEMLAWNMHSTFARIVVQTPVAAALPLAFWGIQCIFSGKGR